MKQNDRSTTARFIVFLPAAFLMVLLSTGCHYSLLFEGFGKAAWSGDGRLALSIPNEEEETEELWVVDPALNEKRPVLVGEKSDDLPHMLAPRWSPDGRFLYCARTTGDDGAGSEDRGLATIVRIDIGTGTSVEVTELSYQGSRDSHFFSSMVYAPLDTPGLLVVQHLGQDGLYQLFTLDVETGSKEPFLPLRTRWLSLCVNGDGNRVACLSADPVPGADEEQLVLHLTDGSGTYLAPPFPLGTGESGEEFRETSIRWSPGGDSLVVSYKISEHRGPSVFPALDQPPLGQYGWSCFAANGADSKLDEPNEDSARLILFDTESRYAILLSDQAFPINPIFNTDGSELAFAAGSGLGEHDGDEMLEIRIYHRQDNRTRVATPPGLFIPFTWSPDGEWITCYQGSNDGDEANLMAVRRDGRERRLILRGAGDRLLLTDQGRGRCAWISGNGAVWVFEGGQENSVNEIGLSPAGMLELAKVSYHNDHLEAALDRLNGIDGMELAPDSGAERDAYLFAALLGLGRSSDAEQVLSQSRTRFDGAEDPARGYLLFSGACEDLGHRNAALEMAEALIELYPDSPEAAEALWAMAVLADQEGRDSDALDRLDRLFQKYPEECQEPGRAVFLASLAARNEDPAIVEKLASVILNANDDRDDSDQLHRSAVARYTLAMAYERLGRVQEALAAYRLALADARDSHLEDGRRLDDECWEAVIRLQKTGPQPDTVTFETRR